MTRPADEPAAEPRPSCRVPRDRDYFVVEILNGTGSLQGGPAAGVRIGVKRDLH